MPGTVAVQGLTELNRAFKQLDRTVTREMRAELRLLSEPVRAGAEENAKREIRNIGDRWSGMRIGVSQSLVYVAPKPHRRGGSPRPNVGTLLMERAMIPSLEEHQLEIVAGLEGWVDHLGESQGF